MALCLPRGRRCPPRHFFHVANFCVGLSVPAYLIHRRQNAGRSLGVLICPMDMYSEDKIKCKQPMFRYVFLFHNILLIPSNFPPFMTPFFISWYTSHFVAISSFQSVFLIVRHPFLSLHASQFIVSSSFPDVLLISWCCSVFKTFSEFSAVFPTLWHSSAIIK